MTNFNIQLNLSSTTSVTQASTSGTSVTQNCTVFAFLIAFFLKINSTKSLININLLMTYFNIQLNFPTTLFQAIWGNGGSRLNDIRESSNTWVEISSPLEGGQIFVQISGSDEQIRAAKKRIKEWYIFINIFFFTIQFVILSLMTDRHGQIWLTHNAFPV